MIAARVCLVAIAGLLPGCGAGTSAEVARQDAAACLKTAQDRYDQDRADNVRRVEEIRTRRNDAASTYPPLEQQADLQELAVAMELAENRYQVMRRDCAEREREGGGAS